MNENIKDGKMPRKNERKTKYERWKQTTKSINCENKVETSKIR